MKIVVFAFDLLWPPNSGGRVDILAQVKALSACGHSLRLYCFSDEKQSTGLEVPMDLAGLRSILIFPFSEKQATQDGVFAQTKVRIIKYFSPIPSCTTRTRLRDKYLNSLLAELNEWSPDLLLVHGIQCVGISDQIRDRIKRLPWIYRAHNDETKYYIALARAEPLGLKKIGLLWQVLRLFWFEPRVLGRADAVLHISVDEWRAFKKRGFQRQLWVPPIKSFSRNDVRRESIRWTIGILSSWFASQKVEGLQWFVERVLPLMPPNFSLVVAGTGAPGWLKNWCESRGITFIGGVENPQDFYSCCAVVVNPVLRGAGVNMKTLEMLASYRPLVTTTAGVCGLPESINRWLRIADTPPLFATAIQEAFIEGPREVPEQAFEEFSAARFCERFSEAYDIARHNVV